MASRKKRRKQNFSSAQPQTTGANSERESNSFNTPTLMATETSGGGADADSEEQGQSRASKRRKGVASIEDIVLSNKNYLQEIQENQEKNFDQLNNLLQEIKSELQVGSTSDSVAMQSSPFTQHQHLASP